MLTIVSREDEVEKAQAQLRKKLDKTATRSGIITFGGKGWHDRREVFWNEKLDLWWTMKEEPDRYWNSFGTQEPKWSTKYPHSIVCEINLPKEVNRRLAGAFAVDENHKMYLLHRGRIGGGREGIGKTLFEENFPPDDWTTVYEGEFSRLVKVAAMDSNRLPNQVANFVHEVERVKGLATSREEQSPPIEMNLEGEFVEKKKFTRSQIIEASYDHRVVVNNLEKYLRLKGFTVGKKSPMDLFILGKNSEVGVLFEIKTDSTRTSYYEAIGQLFFYSSKLNTQTNVVAVFPETISKECKNVLKKLKIGCLTYQWVDDQPRFDVNFKLLDSNVG